MTAVEKTSTAATGSALPQSRLRAEDALSICLAMVAEDASLYRAATTMWKALAPFIAGHTEAQDNLALEALHALANPNPAHHLRRLRRRAGCPELAGIASVLDAWPATPTSE